MKRSMLLPLLDLVLVPSCLAQSDPASAAKIPALGHGHRAQVMQVVQVRIR